MKRFAVAQFRGIFQCLRAIYILSPRETVLRYRRLFGHDERVESHPLGLAC
jgi:hypothetical protein